MKKHFFSSKGIILVALVAVSFFMVQCTKSSSSDSSYTCLSDVSYSKTIKPILDLNCNYAGCHDDVTITSLANYQFVHDGAAQIKISVLSGRMPKGKALATADKNALYCWIDNGAKNN